MFFQALIYVFLAIGAVWLLWNFVFKDILEANKDKLEERGIILEDPEPIETPLTKKLDQLKEEYVKVSASKDASKEAVELAKQIKEMEKEIKERTKDM